VSFGGQAPSARGCGTGPGAAVRPSSLIEAWRAFCLGVRTATGDDAYERYLCHHAGAHPDAAPLSRRAFFEAEQRRKWSGINRCC
jgi:uncharacterized short protein YbdD (DUF466 family)